MFRLWNASLFKSGARWGLGGSRPTEINCYEGPHACLFANKGKSSQRISTLKVRTQLNTEGSLDLRRRPRCRNGGSKSWSINFTAIKWACWRHRNVCSKVEFLLTRLIKQISNLQRHVGAKNRNNRVIHENNLDFRDLNRGLRTT